jgi:hypothetical protein
MLIVRASWSALVLCFFIGAFFVIGIFILHPVYIDVCEASQRGAPQKCEPYDILYVAFLKIMNTITHAEFWTAVATIAIAAFTWTLKRSTDRLWGVTKIAADAAKQSADASLLALRPWVSCEARIISDLTYRTNGDPCITIRFILKNNGHSPAMGVRLIQWFNLLSPVRPHSIHAQQRIADLFKGLPVQKHGLLLFPGETHVSDIELPISRIEIEKSIEDIKPKKHFLPELIGLVSYTYPLASHNPQTGFIFYLRKLVPDEAYGFAFDLDEPIVPAGNITLLAHGLWSEYAT